MARSVAKDKEGGDELFFATMFEFEHVSHLGFVVTANLKIFKRNFTNECEITYSFL